MSTPYYTKFESDFKEQEVRNEIEASQELSENKTDKGGFSGTSQDLKNQLDDAVFNAVKTYDTLAEAQAVSPVPEDGTAFKVSNITDVDNAGEYTFQSSEPNGTRLEVPFKAFAENKIRDIHTYGLPQDFEAVSTAQFSYNKTEEVFESTRIFYVKAPINTQGVSGRYMAIVVSENTTVLQFKTRSAANADLASPITKLKDGKKLVYVDITHPDADHVLFYLQTNSKLYDFYVGDDLPRFEIRPFVINDVISKVEPIWLDGEARKNESRKIFRGQSGSIAVNRLNFGSFKRYLFFDYETSNDSLIMPFFIRVRGASDANILAQFSNEGNTGVIDLLNETNINEAKGFIVVVSTIYQGTNGVDWIKLKNIRTSNSLSALTEPLEKVPSLTTSFEGKDRGLNEFKVGKTTFFGKAPETIRRDNDLTPGGFSDVSMYDYTGKALSQRAVENITYIDTKGTNPDGRILLYVDKTGLMYFKDGAAIKTIQFEDFENGIVAHDQVGLTIDGIEFLTLPANASTQEKTDEWQRMKSLWKMLPDSVNLENYSDAPITATYYASRFGNGSIMSSAQLIRKGGEVIAPKLKQPIVGNPTHVLIYDNLDALVQEIPLADHTDLKVGQLNANQGLITYPDPVGAIIDFSNGKTVTVPIALASGSYRIVLRGRRYSTTLVDGSVNITDDNGIVGSIAMTGNTAFDMAKLVDLEATVNIGETTQLTLTVVCPDEKTLTIGNGSSSRSCWGYTARGRFGTIVEYNAAPNRRAGMSYFTQDNGETWRMLFDVSLNELFLADDGHHMHGACYDPYWKKFYLIGGDSDENRPVHHCDVDKDLTLSNVVWKDTSSNPDLYKIASGEQYCSVYAHKDYVLFGTDFTLTGVFRMPRIDSDNFTDREPCFLINNLRITHVPSVFYQKNEDEELFVMSMKGDDNSNFAPREYQCSLLHATNDGVTFKEVWKDEVQNGGFGLNNFLKVFHYKDKLILQYYNDKRFTNNHTIAVIDYI